MNKETEEWKCVWPTGLVSYPGTVQKSYLAKVDGNPPPKKTLICSHQHKKLEIKTIVNSKDGYGN